jgi:ATP-dependent RNA helicase RhlE
MTFQDLNLNNTLLKALADLGFTKPTTIQQKAFSPIMSGKDVLGIAQTGTGKTYAYLLPLMRQWQYVAKKIPEILIVVPTRELVAQVVEEIEKLAKYANIAVVGVYGGTNIKTQVQAIVPGVDIIVATPGRLLDLIYNGTIRARSIKKLVIDEVDEMLNLGFRAQLKNIINLLPVKRQSLMFTATMTEEVEQFITTNFIAPQKIEAAPTGTPLTNITQIGYKIPNFNTKINFLEYLLASDKSMSKVLVFSSSKRLADEINSRIEVRFPDRLAVIHSNKTQNTRFKTVEQFESGACSVLIATDIVARGLDVTAVSHVINMDVPAVAENYMHRIGRTGRAGKKGVAITFITEADREYKLKVETLMGRKITMKKLPEEVELSDVLTPDEQPQVFMKPIGKPLKISGGKAFHEKNEKNKKADVKVSHFELMKKRFGTKHPDEYRSKKGKSKKRGR